MQSAIYRGRVQHARLGPKPHHFQYGLQLLYLDLDELRTLFERRWLWSLERGNLMSFRRSDYLGAPDRPLHEAVLDRVEEELGRRPRGQVGILTQLRSLGYLFNPVSFYFCRDERGRMDAIVAEITNTPWGERHAYVLDARDGEQPNAGYNFQFDKSFHVSPFFDMQQVYRWRFVWEAERIQVRMTNLEGSRAVFSVALDCERHALSARSLAAALAFFPLQPLRLHAAIYWQALRLYLKRIPFFSHPEKRQHVSHDPIQ